MNVLKFALAIAFSGDRRARWRQVSVIIGSALALCACIATLTLPGAAKSAYEQGAGRTPIYTNSLPSGGVGSDPTDAVVGLVSRGTLVDGRQVPTVWIQPMTGHERDSMAVPPGLESLPNPGEAVLSPGLVSAGVTAEDLGWKTSRSGSGSGGTIGMEGLMTASEPLIYVRPTEGRSLGEGGAVYYAKGFARSDSEDSPAFVLDPEVLQPSSMAAGAVGALLIPGITLLISSARARSSVRDHRLSLMIKLGVRERTARTALSLEAASLALIGAIFGSLFYLLLSPFASHIPNTSITLLPHALSAPWWVYVVSVLGIVAIAGACGALGRVRRRRTMKQARAPRKGWITVLAISLSIIVISGTPLNPIALFSPTSAQAGVWLFGVGALVAMIAAPLAVPTVSYVVAGWFAGHRNAALWAAARRVRFDAVHLSRVPAILALLIIATSTATAVWSASVVAQQEGRNVASRHLMDFSWRDARASDVDSIAQHLERAHISSVVLLRVPQDDSDGPTADKLFVPDCTALVATFNADPTKLCSEAGEADLAEFVRAHAGAELSEVKPEVQDDSLAARIVSPDGLDTAQVQRALGSMPGLNLDLLSSDITVAYPVSQWVVAGGLGAMLLLGIAAAREIGDNSIEDAERDNIYLRLGLSTSSIGHLAWVVFLLPLVGAVATAFFASLIIAYSGQLSGLTHGDLVRLAVVAAFPLPVSIAAVAISFAARRKIR